jgi:hypothetical protein
MGTAAATLAYSRLTVWRHEPSTTLGVVAEAMQADGRSWAVRQGAELLARQGCQLSALIGQAPRSKPRSLHALICA